MKFKWKLSLANLCFLYAFVAAAPPANEKLANQVLAIESPLYQDWLEHSGEMIEKLSPAKSPLHRMIVMEPYDIASVVLGAFGEVLFDSPDGSRDFGRPDTWAVLEKGRIAVISYIDDKPVPLLIIDDELKMWPTEHCPEQFAKAFRPTTWPSINKEGRAVGVERIHVVLPKVYSQRELRLWRRSKPAANMGAFFLDIWGNMRGLCQNEPFPNVIWVERRSDGGLEFIHSGPERNGTFIQAMPDGSVHFVDPEAKSWTGSKEGVQWTVRDDTSGLPTIYACRWVVMSKDGIEILVNANGMPMRIPVAQ